MLWHLVAAVFAGLGAAGIALAFRVVFKNTLPKWLIPVCAGVGMLGYQIYFEYAWFDHQMTRQPDGVVVVSTEQDAVVWRPWTYVWPMTTAFTVVDSAHTQTRQADSLTFVEFIQYRFERKTVDVVTHQRYVLNCTHAQMIPVSETNQALTQRPQDIERNSPLFSVICPVSV